VAFYSLLTDVNVPSFNYQQNNFKKPNFLVGLLKATDNNAGTSKWRGSGSVP
jgi:hypothetical protein